MRCPQCTADSPPESLFCQQCGFNLHRIEALRCLSCSTPLPDRARFCSSCGAPVVHDPAPTPDGSFSRSLHRLLPPQYVDKLLASRGGVDGERRVVTILFSDVKGSTALADRLDPEEVLEIMNGAFEVLIKPIARYEGTLARLMGDAIMAFFGAPIAHEDDAARACHAALDIIEGVRRYAATLESERGVKGFNVRVGLNTGLVVVAEVGSDLRVEYTAMGDAVNLAARMETSAEPGTILLTGATLDHIGHLFDTEAMGPIAVKGKPQPINTHRLLKPKLFHSGPTRLTELQSTLVAREDELALLRNSLLRLENGGGGIVTVCGEMGIGKSRIVHEARKEKSSLLWAETHSYPYTGGMSYRTLRQLLQCLMEEQPDTAPFLSMILGNPRDPAAPHLKGKDHPEEILPHVIQEVHALLRARAAVRPVVMVWDDLQWIDPSSLNVLESLLPLANDLPLLFLLLFRLDGERMGLLRKRISGGYPDRHHAVLLSRLPHSDSVALLERHIGGRTIPRDVQEKVIERTDGNPLFLEEFVRQLLQPRKAIAEPASLPDTLRGVIMARIDGLPPADRRVLQTASVLGRTFQPDLLKQLLPPEISDGDLAQSLEELVLRGFIVPQSSISSKRIVDVQYAFTHGLTHEVAHEGMLLTQRKALHGQAARAIQRSYSGNPANLAEILSTHYEIAGEREEAFQSLIEAGERAKAVYAHLEAINYYRRALKLAMELGITGAMLRNLHEGLGEMYTIAAKYPAALEQFECALALPQNARRRAALHRKKGLALEKSGLLEEAVQSLNQALQVLESNADLSESAYIYSGLSRVVYLQGKLDASVELSNLAREIMEKREDAWGSAHVHNLLGLAHAKLEQPSLALEHFQRALAIWETRDDSYGLSGTFNNLGQFYHQRGNYAEAAQMFTRSIGLCKLTGNRHGLASAYDNLGQSLALDGKVDEGTEYAAKAVAILSDISSEGAEFETELWQHSGIW